MKKVSKGFLICIEGTDCSGKETQSNKLAALLEKQGRKVFKTSFPMYGTATGDIVGACYLGKPHYKIEGFFKEGAANVPAKVASLYYAADRLYNIEAINAKLSQGYIVILDRYVYSNMGHQAGKMKTDKERNKMFNWLYNLEFKMLALPKPNLTMFLHMPLEIAQQLRQNRTEQADQHEADREHLMQAEQAYLHLCKKYKFKYILCAEKDKPKTIDQIHTEVATVAAKIIKNKGM